MIVFKMLLEKNPDVNKMSKYELRALHYGKEKNQKFINDKLILLIIASKNYYTVEDQIELLIKHGAKVDAVDIFKRTALHHVKKGAIALSLIKNQADVNARDEYGSTPLHIGNCYCVRNSIRFIIYFNLKFAVIRLLQY